ncbi:Ig-like domain-containing protein [Lelliottia sp. JS-SCA-14]|uniref:Ig-like domain-containing protein n=1 Tax=Lelliottia sp. JS-SCA-14 TaxID=3110110 RepID=UPI002D7926CF|nr:Ig-like domain-containing protein [Lelliottia sp. JS-SCA-14]
MANTVSKLSATPNPIANDGSQVSTVSATILTDGKPAVADIVVNWAIVGGALSDISSKTDASGIAKIDVTATVGASTVSVTATTADDLVGRKYVINTYTPHVAPTITNANADDLFTLDHYDLQFGVQAEIPIYDNIELNQIVTFYWGEADSREFIITDTVHPPFIIDVTNEMSPDCLKNGTYSVYYSSTTQSGNTVNSSPVPVVVSDDGQVMPSLAKPVVADADPWINISDAGDGVDVEIQYSSIAAGDSVTYFWSGFDEQGRLITQTEATGNAAVVDGQTKVVFTVDNQYFYPNGAGYKGYAEVYYTVQPAASTSVLLSQTLSCLVDTQ